VLLMARCRTVIFGASSNVSLWVALFRGHGAELQQFMDGKWADE